MYYQQPWIYRSPVSRAHVSREENVIKVIGEGSVTAAPDISIITLGTISENQNLEIAQQENNRQMTKVIQSLLGLGIPEQSIKTVDYRIEIMYDYVDSKQILRGYRVTHLLQVTNEDMNKTGTIVDTAVKNGANTVTNIEFSIKQPDRFQNLALTKALSNAQGKARALANEMGVNLQHIPFNISELGQGQLPIPFQTTMYAMMDEAATPIQPGELKMTKTIEAHFTFQ